MTFEKQLAVLSKWSLLVLAIVALGSMYFDSARKDKLSDLVIGVLAAELFWTRVKLDRIEGA